MTNYKEILNFSEKKLQTIESKRTVVVVDFEANTGFDENEDEVVIYAKYYLKHSGHSILDYLKNKVEVIIESEEGLNYSEMSKKELLQVVEKLGIDPKGLSRKKNSEIIEVINENSGT